MKDYPSEIALVEENARNDGLGSSPVPSTNNDHRYLRGTVGGNRSAYRAARPAPKRQFDAVDLQSARLSLYSVSSETLFRESWLGLDFQLYRKAKDSVSQ